MKTTKAVLGIDTSNYKTSAAITDLSGNIISDVRAFLDVKKGERGLRQSDAVFQHVMKLPGILEEAFDGKRDGLEIVAVAVSTRPRPVEGSYMPCFMSGLASARTASLALNVPLYEFSHQEGHIKAVSHGTDFDSYEKFLAYHLSGGTFELLEVSKCEGCGFDIKIIGGTKDISFGQVLDRTGVAMGFDFPCGQEIDRLALACEASTNVLKGISAKSFEINLSGIETQAVSAVTEFAKRNPNAAEDEKNAYFAALAHELMTRIASCLVKLTEKAVGETGIKNVLFSGGVSESTFIRRIISEKLTGINYMFADSGLSSDNAVGIARLGGAVYADKTR